MADRRPYHHGDLRAALLQAAHDTLRDRGPDDLSLRDLARRVGVSHGAPRHHFPDRQALLRALAADGFERLADELSAAIAAGGDDVAEQMRAAGRTFVRFAIDDAALLELMLATALAGGERRAGPERPYVILGELLERGRALGRLAAADPERQRLLVIATFQGIADLVRTRRIAPEATDGLVSDAVALFLGGAGSADQRSTK